MKLGRNEVRQMRTPLRVKGLGIWQRVSEDRVRNSVGENMREATSP